MIIFIIVYAVNITLTYFFKRKKTCFGSVPKMDFPSGNFPNVQYHGAGRCGLDGLVVGRALRLEQTWEIAA